MSEPDAHAETTPASEPPRPREGRAERIRPALEALLFSSPAPIRERDLADALEATPQAVTEALRLIAEDADRPERGVRLEKVAGGWRFVTRAEFDSLLRRYHEVTERSKLSLAALETLAIIAYRQPITLPEIQEVRGVNSSAVVRTLFEKRLITTAGKKPVVGTPFLYRTTQEFLVRFGLNQLDELPQPEEIEEDLAATVGDPTIGSGERESLGAEAPVFERETGVDEEDTVLEEEDEYDEEEDDDEDDDDDEADEEK
ncbi:MAG TPA: SMC-Scp complex subunit ScpB, partial [Thermoanaerobaculia bacterium]